jgi:hypothetical protein
MANDVQQLEEDHQVEIDRLTAIIADQSKKIDALTLAVAPAESVINWPVVVRKLEEEVAMLRKRLVK